MSYSQLARRTAVVTLVALGIVVAALALWKIRIVLAVIFMAMTIAASIRPSVEWLQRHHVPRPAGILAHYAVLLALIGVGLSFVVPRALDQVTTALSASGKAQIAREAQHSTGIKHTILQAIQKRLKNLPSASKLVKPIANAGKKAFEIVIWIFFTFAAGAYWIFERDRVVDLVTGLFPRPKRKLIRDTWTLIDLKLGAFVRGQVLLIAIVATVLSGAFFAIGEPYWILVGIFAGLVEMIPVIGPLAAGVLAVAVGFTSSAHTAILAGICVLAMRLLEDYVIVPKVLGEAVGLSPLLVLVSVTSVGLLFSGWWVLMAVPIAATMATLFSVVVMNEDPSQQEVPAVIFGAKDAED